MANDAPGWLRLGDGERPVWTGRPSLVRVAGPIAVGLALAVLGLVAPVLLPAGLWWISPLAVIGGVLAGTVAAVRHLRVRYVLTTDAVYRRRGLFAREVTRIPLDRVQNTAYSQSPAQRLLGFGTVRLDTAGSGGAELVLESVPDPGHVTGLVGDQVDGSGGRASHLD